MKIGRILLTGGRPAPGLDAEIEKMIGAIFEEPGAFLRREAADAAQLRAALLDLCDHERCPLVLTEGGSGPAAPDIAPDVTREIADRELPGFGEIIRTYSYERSKTAILSRATAGVRGASLIVNLPARPRAIRGCLHLVREALAEGLEQISGTRPRLRVDQLEIPLEKYLPFLGWLRRRVNPGPRG